MFFLVLVVLAADKLVLAFFAVWVEHPADPVVLADFPVRVEPPGRGELVELEIRVADKDRLKAEPLLRSR